jgi:hypothetical protein
LTKRIILFLGTIVLFSSVYAQTRVVYGKLTAFNMYPIQNIEVKTKKSQATVKSDSLGMFSIVANMEDKITIKPKPFMWWMEDLPPKSITFIHVT